MARRHTTAIRSMHSSYTSSIALSDFEEAGLPEVPLWQENNAAAIRQRDNTFFIYISMDIMHQEADPKVAILSFRLSEARGEIYIKLIFNRYLDSALCASLDMTDF